MLELYTRVFFFLHYVTNSLTSLKIRFYGIPPIKITEFGKFVSLSALQMHLVKHALMS
jgi:hypothetical protein